MRDPGSGQPAVAAGKLPEVDILAGLSPLLLEVMIAAAIEAGRAAYAIYRGDFEVQTKQDESPVTAADHAAEQVILAHPRRAQPAFRWWPRSRSPPGTSRHEAGTFFLVDPVDGTKEFIQKRGDFTGKHRARCGMACPSWVLSYAPAKSAPVRGRRGEGRSVPLSAVA